MHTGLGVQTVTEKRLLRYFPRIGGSHGPFNVVDAFLGCSAEAGSHWGESSRAFGIKLVPTFFRIKTLLLVLF